MRHNTTILMAAMMALAVPLAGCLDDGRQTGALDHSGPEIRVADADGEPLAGAWLAALDATRIVLTLIDGDDEGVIHLGSNRSNLPAGTVRVQIGAVGFFPHEFDAAAVPGDVTLSVVHAAAGGAATPSTPAIGAAVDPILQFLPALPLECPAGAVETVKDAAFRANCGAFGEPQLEVAGDGTIWASAVCCVGRSPPIWTSRDGGQSFQVLEGQGTGLVRDAFGIEGDFAIDTAGNVFFFDISAATAWFTSFEADGTHRWTVPLAFPPLVDRPWVRAGGPDEVYIFYNTATSTNFYRSFDGGLTWDHANSFTVPCALATFGQGPDPGRVFLTGCTSDPRLWLSEDKGSTWSAGEPIPMPDGDFDNHRIDSYLPPVADEAGSIYVTFTHTVPETENETAIFVSIRDADGSWRGPFQVSSGGWNEKPWPAAGGPGEYGVAWYHADKTLDQQDEAVWYLAAAATRTGLDAEPSFVAARPDPEPVLFGPFGRNLGDLMQSDVTPDGRLAIVYARNVEGAAFTNLFVQSDLGFDLAPAVFPNGPNPT